jgi:hypothetical protein
MMTPKVARAEYVDVTAAMNGQSIGKEITFNILTNMCNNEEARQ